MASNGSRGSSQMRGAASIEKPKEFKTTMKKLIKYCRKYMPIIIISLIFSAVASVLRILGPGKLSDMTDEISKALPNMDTGIIEGMDLSVVVGIATVLAAFYAISFVLNYLQGLMMASVTQNVSKQMRTDISVKTNKLPLKYYDSTSYGDVLSRITNDVDTIGQTLNQSIGNLIMSVTMLVGTLFAMFYNSWILALVAIGTSFFGFIFMGVIMKKSQKYFTSQQANLGKLNGHIEEIYTGHNVVKVYNGSKEAVDTFEKINADLYVSAWKSQFISGLIMPLMGFVGNLSYVAVCVVGAGLAMNGTITFGTIVAFTLYVRLFTFPFSQIAQAMSNLQRTAASGERVFEFLEEKELPDESKKERKLKSIKGEVEFENVRFGYDASKPVIKNFSAKVKPGQKVAIVGPTGAGKTTLINLLMKFYDIDAGEIRLDNVPIDSVPRGNVQEQFGMVLQDTWIFGGTIKENIVYCKEGVSDSDVKKACKAVGLHHFIKTMPQGYETVLSTKSSLSEGQKQLVTIARAMIQNAPLLILDEATSSVDTRTERIVQEAMDKLCEGRTSFVIAHRLSTIKNSDVILVMKDGDIIESGSHNELLKQKGFYSELYNSQFEL